MVIVLNAVLPYGLKLTFHLEEEIDTKIFGGMCQYGVAFVELKHDIFIFSFCLAQKFKFGISPVFCVLLFYAPHSIFLQKSWQHFLSLQKYCKWTACFHFTSAMRPPALGY